MTTSEREEDDPFDGLSGGGGTGNGNGKRQQPRKSDQKSEKVNTHFAYKYSTGIPLAEQIILGNKSVFLQIDSTQKNHWKPVIHKKLDLSKEQNLILVPHEDGVSGAASFTLAIKFKDLNEIKNYIEQAKKQTIESIYKLHRSIWEKFVVTSDNYSITFLAIDSVYSQLQDLFETTHYDYINGAPGSGKGVKMIVFKLLGYRVVLVTDLSGANVLDLYGSAERNQITIA